MLLDERLVKIAVTEAEEIGRSMDVAVNRLTDAMETEASTKTMLREAEQRLSAKEAEIVAEAAIEAMGKEGPLAGLAVSGPAYKSAVENLLNKAHGAEWAEVSRLRREMDAASTNRETAAIRFSATRHAVDLKAAILRAITL